MRACTVRRRPQVFVNNDVTSLRTRSRDGLADPGR